jgi:gas vesicle protein
VLGVLFAPEKGTETRKKIAKKGKDFVDDVEGKIEKKFDEMMNTISSKFFRVKNDKEPRKSQLAEM